MLYSGSFFSEQKLEVYLRGPTPQMPHNSPPKESKALILGDGMGGYPLNIPYEFSIQLDIPSCISSSSTFYISNPDF